ncbi:MAG: hypothetical protein ACTSU5_19920 [Promethearchaeota archaeon]
MKIKDVVNKIKKKVWDPREVEKPDIRDEALVVKPDDDLVPVIENLGIG